MVINSHNLNFKSTTKIVLRESKLPEGKKKPFVHVKYELKPLFIST